MAGRTSRRGGMTVALAVLAMAWGGCVAKPNVTVVETFDTGEYGRARTQLHAELEPEPEPGEEVDRDYLLQRMRVATLTLADGYVDASGPLFELVYDTLRIQGLNEDKTVTSVVINEDLKIWKGEPFEQAIAYSYIATQLAAEGSWDNARAAASNALFHLRDFGSEGDEPLDTETLVTRAAEHDAESNDEFLDTYYVVEESDFVFGHLLSAVANQQLGRMDEANGHYQQALDLDGAMEDLVEQLRGGEYNTLLVVSYGRGPEKIGTGPDNAISKFIAHHQSDNRPLLVEANGYSARWPVVTDVNRMATDHRWNSLEDMRVAKSHVGTGLMVGGGTLAMASNNEYAQLAGLGMMAAGAFAKAGSHADTRYCEALPQRLYLVPLTVDEPGAVTLQLAGEAGTRMNVLGLAPPEGDEVTVRYVRMVNHPTSVGWAMSRRLHYTNPHAVAPDGLMLPYVLGGHCVRPPSDAVLADYHRAGFLRDLSLSDLEELYRQEEIVWQTAPGEFPGLHVLEGGDSLVAPQPGTAGYLRLFAQPHDAYQPRSEYGQTLYEQVQTQRQSEQIAQQP